MRVGLDVTPLQKESNHAVRGSGFYLRHLLSSLKQYCPENDYIAFAEYKTEGKDIDILHIPYFEPFFLHLPLRRQYPTIVTVHDLIPIVHKKYFPSGMKGSLKWSLQKQLLKRVNAIITDSTHSKKDIVKVTGVSDEKIHVIPLAPAEHFLTLSSEVGIREIRKKYELPEKFMLYVGDVTWNKNLPRLLRALSDTEIPCILVGKALAEANFDRVNPWNKDRIEVQKLAANAKNIKLVGYIPDTELVELYNAATVFVFPSLSEGFGLPVLEAMSCGVPVITTQQGSVPEVAGDAALYVDAYDEKSIKNGIEKVFNDVSLQNKLRESGYRHVKKFSWKKTAEMTSEVYKKVLHTQ